MENIIIKLKEVLIKVQEISSKYKKYSSITKKKQEKFLSNLVDNKSMKK